VQSIRAFAKHAKGSSSPITSRADDYSQWYLDVVRAADVVDQSPVKGCMVIKPWGMGIWERLRDELDRRITNTGTDNVYFPLLIPQSFLSKEAQHVEGFAKECAVVTHHRLRVTADGKGVEVDPAAKLDEPLVVRPTSETLIWNTFSKWVQAMSHRELPLKINQWANVFRWELRTRPFLRSAEFLWQEGHTAHATSDEAVEFSHEILDLYADVCEEVLAIPVVQGYKSESERFAGADETLTIEAMMQNGWALQSGTSHFLGQNFAKAFNVHFQDPAALEATAAADGPAKGRSYVWATSWGVSTRLMGALVMSHSDDLGLVLPPNVAPVQVVIIPFVPGAKKNKKKQQEAAAGEGGEADPAKPAQPAQPAQPPVLAVAHLIQQQLRTAGLRAEVDDRAHVRPGAKFFEWEQKGVPLRLELGPRDLGRDGGPVAIVTRRFDGKKIELSVAAELERAVAESAESESAAEEGGREGGDAEGKGKKQTLAEVLLMPRHQALEAGGGGGSGGVGNPSELVLSLATELADIQVSLLERARNRLESNTFEIDSYDTMRSELQALESSGSSGSEGKGGVYGEDGAYIPQFRFYRVPWADNAVNEAAIQEECKATIRCYPLAEQHAVEGRTCFYSGRPATHIALFARAY
jgi:prolyl-tRNA synthetase